MAGNTHGFWWLVAGGRFSYGLRVAGFAAKTGPIRNRNIPHSAFPIPNSNSSAAAGYEPAAAYSPASARHVRVPVDRQICWLQ